MSLGTNVNKPKGGTISSVTMPFIGREGSVIGTLCIPLEREGEARDILRDKYRMDWLEKSGCEVYAPFKFNADVEKDQDSNIYTCREGKTLRLSIDLAMKKL